MFVWSLTMQGWNAEKTTGERSTIIVVDDEPGVVKLVEICLTAVGHRSRTASSGLEALEILDQLGNLNVLLLTDIDMPGMSGVELASAAVQRCPDCQVLLMSGLPCPMDAG